MNEETRQRATYSKLAQCSSIRTVCVCVLALEVYVCSSIRNVCVLASEVSVPASELSVSQYSSIILEGESRNVVSNYFFWRAFYLEMLDERL